MKQSLGTLLVILITINSCQYQKKQDPIDYNKIRLELTEFYEVRNLEDSLFDPQVQLQYSLDTLLNKISRHLQSVDQMRELERFFNKYKVNDSRMKSRILFYFIAGVWNRASNWSNLRDIEYFESQLINHTEREICRKGIRDLNASWFNKIEFGQHFVVHMDGKEDEVHCRPQQQQCLTEEEKSRYGFHQDIVISGTVCQKWTDENKEEYYLSFIVDELTPSNVYMHRQVLTIGDTLSVTMAYIRTIKW